MNASAKNTNDPNRPSQYSLAAMFYITTLMSLVFSATAPFFRAINAENRIAILLYGGFQIVVLMLCLFGFMSSRLRAVLLTDKGELVHRTSFMEQGALGFWRSLQALWTTIPAMLILMGAGICITREPGSVAVFLNPYALALQVFAIREAVQSSLSLYYGVDKRDLEVFQSGFVYGGYHYHPWKAVKSIRPAEYDMSALMLVFEQITTFDEHKGVSPISTLYTKKLSVRAHIRSEIVDVMLGLLRDFRAI